MQETNEPNNDVDDVLRDISDFERFFGDADEELSESDLELMSAAGNYAAFRSRLGLDDEDGDER